MAEDVVRKLADPIAERWDADENAVEAGVRRGLEYAAEGLATVHYLAMNRRNQPAWEVVQNRRKIEEFPDELSAHKTAAMRNRDHAAELRALVAGGKGGEKP